METNKEQEYAEYFYEVFSGHLAVSEDVDPLLAHVALRRLLDHGINMVLDRWNAERGEDDGRGRE